MAKLSKKKVEQLSESLLKKSKSVWDSCNAAQRNEIMDLGEKFKSFLDAGKTERLAVNEIRRQAKAAGFKPIGAAAKGKRFFMDFRGKVIALVVLGKKSPSTGLRLVGSHLDSPRLDLKANPLYEEQELAFLKTHYYGGIKKYQWMARPLAIHGVVCLDDGKTAAVSLGEDPDGPVFTLLDLLPHLSRKSQGEKKLNEAIQAEKMNLVIGGLPIDSEEGSDKVKLAVLQELNKRYGMTEEDFISAELEIVPAGPSRDVGLDRALVGGYGQDDRAASFAALEAILALKAPEVTSVALFVDKEEVGSDGATGAKSSFVELLFSAVLAKAGDSASYMDVCRAMAASQMISADASPALDPDYPEVHEKRNAAKMGYGVCLTKYTGSGGKYMANDADAEFVAWIRGAWNRAGVNWQTAAMGKVDEGGGGTIAKLLASRGMEVIDAGPALLSMHSPFEISHKADIFATLKAYEAFFLAPTRS